MSFFKHLLSFFVISFISAYFFSVNAVEPVAFPGASGFGAKSVGGRGGKAIEVTNLNDSGAGSLRGCVTTVGPRICVFRLGGTITLLSDLKITEPYLTIAGQTAPGGGITLRTDPSNKSGLVTVRSTAHDVIIRYIRSRPGTPTSQTDTLDAFTINSYNVILDHVSASWAIDENVNFWYATAHDITIQNSIIAEALNNSAHLQGPHSKGLLSGNENSIEVFVDRKNSIVRNLFAHNYGRNPETKQGQAEEVVNNVVYNWSKGTSATGATLSGNWEGSPSNIANRVQIDIIGNYYIVGPNWTNTKEVGCTNDHFATGSKLYVHDNIGPNRTIGTMDDWSLVDASCNRYVTDSRASSTVTASITQAQPATVIKDLVLNDSGANKGLNADGTIFMRPDAVDKRIVEEVKSGGGKIIDCPGVNSCYGGSTGKVYLVATDYTKYSISDPIDDKGWPVLTAGTAPADTDHDGMPDIWEQSHGENIASDDGAADRDGDGYTNLEEYLNSADVAPVTPSPTVPASYCQNKQYGDADCKSDSNNKFATLPDFEIWRKEYFSDCNQASSSTCGSDEDNDGSAIDANFNYPGSNYSATDTKVDIGDFEIWRKSYFQ